DQEEQPGAAAAIEPTYGGQETADQPRQQTLHGKAGHRVRVAAVVQEVAQRRGSEVDDREVDVRQVGGKDARGEEQPSLGGRRAVLERHLRQGGADERMSEVVQTGAEVSQITPSRRALSRRRPRVQSRDFSTQEDHDDRASPWGS